MEPRDLNIFSNNFTAYDDCAPPGVLLPKTKIEKRHYDEVGVSSDVDNLTFLKKLCWTNMQKMGFTKSDKEYIDRLKLELDILDELGFIDYILLNWDILNFCRENDIPVGKGRGSAPSSLVLYFLRITDVDPIKHRLFFERFVSRARAKKIEGKDGKIYLDGGQLADVDNDIAYDRRQEVIDYIARRHGGKTCKILNLVTLSSKLCLKEVGKLVALQSEDQMNYIGDQIPSLFGSPAKLEEAVLENEKIEDWSLEFPEAFSIAQKLQGLIKNTGVHASGIAISYHELTDICPIQKTKEGDLISCYDMNWVAELMVKFDILGLKTLTVLNDSKKILKEEGIDFNYDEVDLEDPFIYNNLRNLQDKGRQGLFQIEADTNYDVCKRVKPKTLGDLAAIVAIGRPGALQFKDKYAHYVKTGETKSLHPFLDEVFKETAGVCIYQESLMHAIVKLGFSADDANTIRKIVGKKKVDEMPEWKEKIYKKAEEGNIPKEAADIVWRIAEDSANYSFNKCLLPETIVEDKDGFKCLFDVNKGDKILAYNVDCDKDHYVEVLDVHENEVEVYEVEMGDGTKISCSMDHKFLCSDKKMHTLREILSKNLEIMCKQ